jgi:hypothetical protein
MPQEILPPIKSAAPSMPHLLGYAVGVPRGAAASPSTSLGGTDSIQGGDRLRRQARCQIGRRSGSTQGQQDPPTTPDLTGARLAWRCCLRSSRERMRNRPQPLLIPRSQVRSLPGPLDKSLHLALLRRQTRRRLGEGDYESDEPLTGVDRSVAYEYWLRGDSSTGLAILDRGEVVAVAATTRSGIAHLACRSEAHASSAVLAALSICKSRSASLALPGPHPAVPALLERGFRITDYDIHMSSDDVVLSTTSAYSPALG